MRSRSRKVRKNSRKLRKRSRDRAHMRMKKEDIEREVTSDAIPNDIAWLVSQYHGTLKEEKGLFSVPGDDIEDAEPVIWRGIVDDEDRKQGIWEGEGKDLFVTVNYVNGVRHSERDQPAIVSKRPNSVFLLWLDHDVPHREGDQPAAVGRDKKGNLTNIEYYKHGQLHRLRGPAQDIKHDSLLGGRALNWYVNGHRHRNNGPAEIHYYPSGKLLVEAWYIDDFHIKTIVYDIDGNIINEIHGDDDDDGDD